MRASEPGRPLGVPAIVAGRYVVGDVIGDGGRSVVYAAEDPLLGRDVAVKVFRGRAASAADVKRQEAEARLIAGLNHYALTTLFDAGVDASEAGPPRVYLVMERIPGVDLERYVREHGALTPAQVAYLGFDLAEGLQAVHEHGFLHRDIKPANILLAERRIETRIRGKLADFGISSLIGGVDAGEFTSGTAAYLSPEQAEGQEPTTASDVYSLGLVLLEAATGRIEYPGGTSRTLNERLDRRPRIPSTLPPGIADVLRRMTAMRPADRPDPTTIALAFQRAFVDDLVEAGRVDPDRLAQDEERRLAAVRRYDILDTPPDDAFDRITRLACRLLDVPIAFVSIIDADREWFKSSRGIDVTELDRNIALCASSVATGEPIVVADVQIAPDYEGNPIVVANPDLHAFAAVPLTTLDGHAIGTLCVFDRRRRCFTPEDVADLEELAAIAIRELDLRLASRRAIFSR